MTAPDGPQWVIMYHASRYSKPPHSFTPKLENYTNAHPDVIHMGSLKSAQEMATYMNRRYIHEYHVPTTHIYPVTFGDESGNISELDVGDEKKYLLGRDTPLTLQMKGKSQGLFESVPGDPHMAVETGMAIPYRNLVEDVGSISHMVPKSLIKQKHATWSAVHDLKPGTDEDYDW